MNQDHRSVALSASLRNGLALGLLTASVLAPGAVQAQWVGNVGLSTDYVVRGVTQSDRDPSAQAYLGWRHSSGLAAGMGVASVSKDQFVGSQGFKLMPEVSWSGTDAAQAWRYGVSMNGSYFPGAKGPWAGKLPAAAQNRLLQAQESDYGTLEVGAMLGYKWATLSVVRSLDDYLGLSAQETGPFGTRLIESKGTTYVGLDFAWPVNDKVTLGLGVGRLTVPNFEAYDYSDWRVSVAVKAWDLLWTLKATGNTADQAGFGIQRRSSSGNDKTASTTVSGSVSWGF